MRLIQDILTDLKKVQEDFDTKKDHNEIRKCIEGYNDLLNQVPDDPEIIFQMGTAFLQLGCYGTATQFYRRTLAYWPDNSHTWSNLGVCYRSMHILPKARDCFMKSLMCDEKGETYNNLASCYINEDCPELGLPYAERAMEMSPDHPKPKWNAGLLQLELMNWDQGFRLYDAGFFCGERQMRYYTNDKEKDIPWWDGKSEGTLVVWDEQGLGDRLLAVNLLRNLEKRGDVILECHPRIAPMLKRSFPWIEHIYPTSKDDKIDWPVKHQIKYKCSIMSLAKFFWNTGNFDRTPYLVPDPERVKKYREQIESLGKPPYIAFSWAGGAQKTNTGYRSLKLSWLKPLIELGGTWISVQYHPWAKEKVDKFRESTGLPVYHLDAAQEFDYDETLAALAACDLTISACNTVIHTCGAAGLDCWVLVPKKRAWRYPKGDSIPWYGDHIRQIHQGTDKWETVIDRVKEELKEWLCKHVS